MTLRHLLEIDDLTAEEITDILDRSSTPQPRVLEGRGVALIFEKPSLRTRHAGEMATFQLGGHPAYIQDSEIALDKREKTEDITRVMEGYYDIICARVFEHRQLERMASVAKVPIVNLLSNTGHPMQALADLLTIRQEFGTFAGIRLAWVGDFSNVAFSLGLGLVRLGASIVYCCPPGYGPDDAALDRLRLAAVGDGSVETASRPEEAVMGANVVATDAWYSMGQESEKDIRKKAFEGFCVTRKLMDAAASNAIFMHCLPAHRGEEVTDEVIDGAFSRVLPEAANRMHTQRGLFSWFAAQGSLR